jgi:catechol 2,3-dioxygenase-like lactoylglutathione lyase family enzyme
VEFLDLLGSTHLYGEIAVGVKDIDRAIGWYCDVFGLDSGMETALEVTLGYRGGKSRSIIPLVVLVKIPEWRTAAAVERHPMLFTRNLRKIHQDLVSKGINPGPIQEDTGGNHFFRFQDLERNEIEVCLEPGKKLG